MEEKKLGGAFAWGLGEDADDFVHLRALTAEMKKYERVHKGLWKSTARKSGSFGRPSPQDEL